MPRPRRLALSPGVWVYEDEAPRFSNGEKLCLAQLPSEAFGDGSHPTTRVCAGAVDLLCRQKRPKSFLDVGTGTGILARIARARGVSEVVGTDISPVALVAAQGNSALDPSEISRGVQIEFENRPPDHWGARFELVVANILEGPLRELAPSLAGALIPGGYLLVSGFTPFQTPVLRVTFSGTGLNFISESILEGWSLLQFYKPIAR